MFRRATPSDVPALTALINLAYQIEWFKIDNRTNEQEIGALVTGQTFLVHEENGAILACVLVSVEGERGYFGMLAVDPKARGQSLGRRLVAAAEAFCKAAGCRVIELEVVNLRTELLPYYRALGYEQTATTPFPRPEATTEPCHMLIMSKAL